MAQALREDGPGYRQAQQMLKSNNIHHHHQHIPPLVHVQMHPLHRLHPLHPLHHPYIPMYECPIPAPSSYFNTPIFPREAPMNTHDVCYPPNPVSSFGSNKKARFSLDSRDSSHRSAGNTFGFSFQQETVTFSHLSQESKNQTGFRESTSDESDERLKRRIKEDRRLPQKKRRKKGIFSDSRVVRTSSSPASESESDSDSDSESESDSDSEDSVIFLPYCVGARSS